MVSTTYRTLAPKAGPQASAPKTAPKVGAPKAEPKPLKEPPKSANLPAKAEGLARSAAKPKEVAAAPAGASKAASENVTTAAKEGVPHQEPKPILHEYALRSGGGSGVLAATAAKASEGIKGAGKASADGVKHTNYTPKFRSNVKETPLNPAVVSKPNPSIVENIFPPSLKPTHAIQYGTNKLNKFIEKIAQEGIKKPIEYVTHNGEKYVVDGHHRLYAARKLKLTEIPAVEVKLPHKGYKTVNDLNYTL